MARDDLILVDLDVQKLGKPIEEVRRQAPFIFASALTRSAQDCRGDIRGTLGDHFEIRREFLTKGIRITPAKKTHLTAEVGSVDTFMRLHATGGTAQSGTGGDLAVPMPGGGRPTPQSETPMRKWPSRILARAERQAAKRSANKAAGKKLRATKPKPFVATINNHPGVYIRTSKERFPVKALWIFKKSVHQPADWPFWKEVQKTVDRVWASNVVAAMDKALSTALPKK